MNLALLGQPTILTPLQPLFNSMPQWVVIPIILLGMAISNGLVALGGALFAQIYGNADFLGFQAQDFNLVTAILAVV